MTTPAPAPAPEARSGRTVSGLVDAFVANFAIPLIAIVLALLVGAVVIILSSALVPGHGFDWTLPITAYKSLFSGAFGSPEAWTSTLLYAAPLALAGLGVALGFKAGLFNIGAQGQFLMGALGAAAVGGAVHDSPPVIAITLAVLGGILAGAVWGRDRRCPQGHLGRPRGRDDDHDELHRARGPVVGGERSAPPPQLAPADHAGRRQRRPADHLRSRRPPRHPHRRWRWCRLIWFLLYRTTRGFEIRTLGANLDAARYAGMRPRLLTVLVMGIAGGLAGLAGTGNLLGINHQVSASFGTTVGFDSITVALLGRSNPFGVALAALFFGGMRSGAGDMQVQAGLPTELVDVIEAVLLFFLVVGPLIGARLRIRGVKTGLGDANRVSAALGGEVAH